MTRWIPWTGLLSSALVAAACSGSTDEDQFPTSAGAPGKASGGTAAKAGASSTAGSGTGGSSNGGTSTAGAATGGAGTTAGASSAGSNGTAGNSTAGSTGAAGSSTAGTGSGGTGNGGTGSGGTNSAGTSSGGTSSAGTSSGGSAGGGNTTGADQCKPIGWSTRANRTGGAFNVTGGGNATPIVVKTWADLSKYAADGTARVLHIDGNLGGGWSGKEGDRLEIASNRTIVGIRPGTQVNAAIHINGSSNVILRNVIVRGPGSNGEQAWDNISIEGATKNVWVDHSEFWDGQDGNADVVKGADTVTFTWCIFGYSKKGDHNLSNPHCLVRQRAR